MAMADEKHLQCATEPEQDQSLFVLGMVGVTDQQSVLVKENRLRLLE